MLKPLLIGGCLMALTALRIGDLMLGIPPKWRRKILPPEPLCASPKPAAGCRPALANAQPTDAPIPGMSSSRPEPVAET